MQLGICNSLGLELSRVQRDVANWRPVAPAPLHEAKIPRLFIQRGACDQPVRLRIRIILQTPVPSPPSHANCRSVSAKVLTRERSRWIDELYWDDERLTIHDWRAQPERSRFPTGSHASASMFSTWSPISRAVP